MKTFWIVGRLSIACMCCCLAAMSLGCNNPLQLIQSFIHRGVQSIASTKMLAISADANGSKAGSADSDETPKFPPAEELVKDWEKPDIALFVTGRLHGYIEPCGCTGLDKQKGGLLRRRTCQSILQKRGWDLINIDAGNQVRRVSQQAGIKLRSTYEALCKKMDYQAIGLGVDDLKLPAIDLYQTLADVVQGETPFVCANAVVLEDSITKRFSVVEKNGKRIGITMIVGDEHLPSLRGNSDVMVKPVATALKEVANQMKSEKCDFYVLISQSDPETCKKIAAEFPIFDLLITSGGAGDPTLLPELIRTGDHTTNMIQVGVKGMYAGIVGIYEKNGKQQLKYERVPMDARFTDAPEMRKLFVDYQNQLKLLWEAGNLTDIKPRRHPSGNRFVGSAACADCHQDEFDIWKDGVEGADFGPHARATADLTDPGERTWVKRNFDPECVSCHAVGWNPQLHYPYESGFVDLAKDIDLHGNGCENCHGPGSAHVESEESGEESLDLRKAMIVTKEEAAKTLCLSCHDLDNSPDYALDENGFEKFWPHIAHGDDD